MPKKPARPPPKSARSPRRKSATKPDAAAPPLSPSTPPPVPTPEPRADARAAASEAERQTPLPDFEALARNLALLVEEGGKVFSAYLKPLQSGEFGQPGEDLSQMAATLGRIAEYYMSDAERALQAQSALSSRFLALWAATLRRLQGDDAPPVAAPHPGDKRFADPEWRDNPYFDFLKQAYVLTSDWARELVTRAEDIDPQTRAKAQFYLRQVTSALSPSNFIPTNPELMRATLAESGENLVRGLRMMAEDIAAGGGALRIRQSDASQFALGVNLAVTPGKVVFRNDLIELIQYAPTSATVYKRPLLIVPPWINKFYVLDLNAQKSFVGWAVANGLSVFVVSWVNPDQRHADKGFESYLREGVYAALDAIEQATGEREVSAIGYCVGGTLLAIALGLMAAERDSRIASATLLATQVDFVDAGDLKVFVDAEQLKALERKMEETGGFLEGAHMASAFNMLRPDELIWSFFVNNYLKGKEPMPFDLLVWNADSTRMPAANHRFYLRHCYLQNDLAEGRLEIEGRRIDLASVTIPLYELATREDHIAPARSVFTGAKLFGGDVRFVLAGSGHIAGVVNPPDKPKYQHWTGGAPLGAFEDWLKGASETAGSWWPDWLAWITAQAPEQVAARQPGGGKLAPLADAPGEYVRVRS